MMTTPAQAAANKRNAASSTGPRSAAGRARSSRNSLKHGLTARIATLPESDRLEFADLLQGFNEYWAPVGRFEEELVVQIAVAHFQQRRAFQIESELLAPGERDRDDDGPGELASAFTNMLVPLDRCSRHWTAAERRGMKAADRLQALQAARGFHAGEQQEDHGAREDPSAEEPEQGPAVEVGVPESGRSRGGLLAIADGCVPLEAAFHKGVSVTDIVAVGMRSSPGGQGDVEAN